MDNIEKESRSKGQTWTRKDLGQDMTGQGYEGYDRPGPGQTWTHDTTRCSQIWPRTQLDLETT